MLAWLSARPPLALRLARSPPKDWGRDYPHRLAGQGYSKETLRKCAGHLLAFGEFLERQDCSDLDDVARWVEPFLAQPPSPRCRPVWARSSLNSFLRHLRQTGAIPVPEPLAPAEPGAELV